MQCFKWINYSGVLLIIKCSSNILSLQLYCAYIINEIRIWYIFKLLYACKHESLSLLSFARISVSSSCHHPFFLHCAHSFFPWIFQSHTSYLVSLKMIGTLKCLQLCGVQPRWSAFDYLCFDHNLFSFIS